MAVRSRRPWMSVALGLVLGFTAASWLIAPRVAELSERKRRGSSLCSYYGRSAAGPGAGAQQPLPQPQHPPRLEQSPPPARPELQGPQLPGAALGVTSFRSSPWQQPPPLQQRRRGHEPEGATGLPGAPMAEGEPEEDGGAAGQRTNGRPGSSHNGSGDGGATTPSSRPRDFLYVGVMTAQKYLGSRALAAQRTWARFIPGRVEFFSSQQPPNAGLGQPPPPLPVIALPGVDDSYPPQKKSFMMIKYMHDHYLDKYEWFMRADDDVYIKGDLPALAVLPDRFLSLQPAPIPAQPLCASLPARAHGYCSPHPVVPTPRIRPPFLLRSSSPAAWALLTPAWLYLPSSPCFRVHLVLASTLNRRGVSSVEQGKTEDAGESHSGDTTLALVHYPFVSTASSAVSELVKLRNALRCPGPFRVRFLPLSLTRQALESLSTPPLLREDSFQPLLCHPKPSPTE
ncbi:Chondroitin sulfate synthase 3 [Galemys pyrenaicus]|uniref:Chondroitin sulfate synthase 3 n=1 Tax=Galemys pyrenaicus TaxID=202257 RepID=A0A8J6A7W9_GALPY|nr:Chondroitin sulfate synthase 3 [Galemys pyrenaicus]